MIHPRPDFEPHASAMPALPPLLITFSMLSVYLYAVFRQERLGKQWSGWRTSSFIGGSLLLAVAFLPPLIDYAHRDLRGHMIQHLLIGMFAPLGLVLAAPLTLAYRTLPRSASLAVTKSLRFGPMHWLSHPLVALALNIGGMFVLYTTPLFRVSAHYALLHWLAHIHFLLAGCLFVWSIAGPDPAPRRSGMRTRFLALFLSMAAHAYLSKLMYVHDWPSGTGREHTEIQAAAKLMYYGGDLAEVLLASAFFAIWYRRRRKSAPHQAHAVKPCPRSMISAGRAG